MKQIRGLEIREDMTGKPVVVGKREVRLEALPRVPHEIDCGFASGKLTIMVSHGQIINEKKICRKNQK